MRSTAVRPLAIWGTLCLTFACSSSGPGSAPDAAPQASSGDTQGPTTSGNSSGDGDGDGDLAPLAFESHPAPLRRLTRRQFQNAIGDLLGAEVDIHELDSDNYSGDFAVIGAAKVVTSALGVEQYQSAVESAIDAAFSDEASISARLGCTPSSESSGCIEDFLTRLGRRAWRRPLQDEELTQLKKVADTASEQLGSPIEGARFSLMALLLSPNFLYRPELGAGSGSSPVRLTDYELASRLSFLIWNSLPDDSLLDAAEQGLLSTEAGLRAEAERLLDHEKGREALAAFGEEYMRVERVLTQAKDQQLFPEYGTALQEGMVLDMREVWAKVGLEDDGSLLDLFSTTDVYANAAVAKAYGLDASGLDAVTYRFLSLPEDGPRIGIMSKLGFLSQFANQKEGSPTLRGKFISEQLLCKPIEPPPGGVALELPESTEGAPSTKRQRLEKHREDAVCANCHEKMDPLGLPFESFDAVGNYRTLDSGLPVDPSGSFDGTPVQDARELGLLMSQSSTVANCIVRKYYSYAVGHEERDVDQSVVDSLSSSFETSGYRARQLILDIVASEAFSTVIPQL